MILVLFLISVGVMELILRNDRKKQDSAARDRVSTPGKPLSLETPGETRVTPTASAVTNSLLSLMNAVQGEPGPVEPEIRPAATEGVRQSKSADDGPEKAEKEREYNQKDAGVR